MVRLGKKERQAQKDAKKDRKNNPTKIYNRTNKDRSKEKGIRARGGAKTPVTFTTTVKEPVIDKKTGKQLIDAKGNKVFITKELIVGSPRRLSGEEIQGMLADNERHGLPEDVLDKYTRADRSIVPNPKPQPVKPKTISKSNSDESGDQVWLTDKQKLERAKLDAKIWRRLTDEEKNLIRAHGQKGEGADMYPALARKIEHLREVILAEEKEKKEKPRGNIIPPVFRSDYEVHCDWIGKDEKSK